ncbi:MAG: hypothetical protein NC115_08045 [Bacteroidales bacterium]|nr:hypothetical protein [Bacteroidales bacterium]
MKHKLLVAVGAAAAVSVFVYVQNGNNAMDEFFDANVEALADDEIIVGDLCRVCPNAACVSLGVVYKEHIRP